MLFETNGYFYVHENCAIWSDGVTAKKPVKDEKEKDKTPEKVKKTPEYLIGNVQLLDLKLIIDRRIFTEKSEKS